MAKRFNLKLSDQEAAWLAELAWQNRLSGSEVLRLLIHDAAKRVGLPALDELPRPASAEVAMGSRNARRGGVGQLPAAIGADDDGSGDAALASSGDGRAGQS